MGEMKLEQDVSVLKIEPRLFTCPPSITQGKKQPVLKT